jgi:hypothetical protein
LEKKTKGLRTTRRWLFADSSAGFSRTQALAFRDLQALAFRGLRSPVETAELLCLIKKSALPRCSAHADETSAVKQLATCFSIGFLRRPLGQGPTSEVNFPRFPPPSFFFNSPCCETLKNAIKKSSKRNPREGKQKERERKPYFFDEPRYIYFYSHDFELPLLRNTPGD